MAQNVGSWSVRVCRACRHQIQKSTFQQRTFSSTPRPQKIIPAFQESSSPELDDLLITLRNKVFVPEIVTPAQRKLIYKPSRQSILLNDPGITYATSDGEEVRLMPLHIHDRPRKEQSLYRIIELMKQPEDWKNLPPLLEGLKMSKQNPQKLGWWEKMIRKAGEAGQIGLILHCAEMGERTGIYLTSPAVVEEIVATLHSDAAAAQWKGEELDRLLKMAERMVRIIESTASNRKLREGEYDYRRSPEIAGLLLELYAAKALHESSGKDEDGKVLNLAKKVDSLWQFGDYSIDEQKPTYTLSFLIPLWNGIKQALKVDSVTKDPTGSNLQGRLQEIELVINQARDLCIKEANGKPRRGLNMYNALV